MSTVPVSLLNKFFPAEMATIRYAHVPSPFAGDKLLQMLAEKILLKKELHCYFYPEYVLRCGRASLEAAEAIIRYLEVLPLFPQSYETEQTDALRFFVLTQTYLRKKRHIIRTAHSITRDEFTYNFIFDKEMEQEFERIDKKGCMYLELVEDGEVEYVLVIDSREQLCMFVSV